MCLNCSKMCLNICQMCLRLLQSKRAWMFWNVSKFVSKWVWIFVKMCLIFLSYTNVSENCQIKMCLKSYTYFCKKYFNFCLKLSKFSFEMCLKSSKCVWNMTKFSENVVFVISCKNVCLSIKTYQFCKKSVWVENFQYEQLLGICLRK